MPVAGLTANKLPACKKQQQQNGTEYTARAVRRDTKSKKELGLTSCNFHLQDHATPF